MAADTGYLRGLANVRDLGGLPVPPSGTTRAGILLRSDAPHPGDEPPTGLAWPPATVIELRAHGEGSTVHPLADGAVVHRIPLLDPAQICGQHLPGSLTDMYLGLLDTTPPPSPRWSGSPRPHRLRSCCTVRPGRTGQALPSLCSCCSREFRRWRSSRVMCWRTRMPAVMERVAARPGRLAPPTAIPGHLIGAPAEAILAVVRVFMAHPAGPVGWAVQAGVQPDVIDTWRNRFVLGDR